ncbi:MAG: hypothetical protein H0V82_10200 [Candidatus Protochlamydia sp.]|nr:hypothetical protein [Candidatus Protochlamydia sp.]
MTHKFNFFSIIPMIFFGILLSSNSYAEKGSQVFAGPEIYFVKRTKEGGVEQHGNVYGIRVGYERVKRCKIYLGIDFLYAKGCLKGKLLDAHLKSNYTDINLEERVGYTFEAKCGFRPSLTPFIGYGRIWENNDYVLPSPACFHFHNNFTYVPVGFLSRFFACPSLSIGLNFKARFILDGKNKVSNDPNFDTMVQNYDEKIQYRVELPFCYNACLSGHEIGIDLIPFYEYRRYGKRANFPFDFLETKFVYYGATLKLAYLF